MRTTRTAPGLVLLLSLAACGGDEGGDAAPGGAPSSRAAVSSSPTPSAAPVLSEADLSARLLGLPDLPSGFVVTPPADPAAEEEDPRLVSADPACQAFLDAAEVDSTAPAAVEVEFENPDTLESISQEIESFEPGGAEASFVDAREGLAACRVLALEGTEGELTVQQQSFTGLGDETVAVRIDGEVDLGDGTTAPVAGTLVGVRAGNNVISVTVFGVGGLTVDTEAVVRTAVAKFEAAG